LAQKGKSHCNAVHGARRTNLFDEELADLPRPTVLRNLHLATMLLPKKVIRLSLGVTLALKSGGSAIHLKLQYTLIPVVVITIKVAKCGIEPPSFLLQRNAENHQTSSMAIYLMSIILLIKSIFEFNVTIFTHE
jgi:hypothetical protein